jgi:hypothetical protein
MYLVTIFCVVDLAGGTYMDIAYKVGAGALTGAYRIIPGQQRIAVSIPVLLEDLETVSLWALCDAPGDNGELSQREISIVKCS